MTTKQSEAHPVTCTGHEPCWCDSPGCPGRVVKHKLEALEEALNWWHDEFGSANTKPQWIRLAEAAIAKANSPQAR